MKSFKNISERGQSLVVVILLFLAFIAVLGLVLDGGRVYAARRQAQNAADAGALAGATHLCTYIDQANVEAAAEGVARDYALKNNALNPPQAVADKSASTVIVTATVEVDPFFIQFIGFSDISPSAVAEAQCQPPSGYGIMPVAWSCRSPVTGDLDDEATTIPQLKCEMEFGPCSYDGMNGLSCTYVFMDSIKVIKNPPGKCKKDDWDTDPDCIETGDIVCDDPSDGFDEATAGDTIDCDLDNDKFDDLKVGGARSWLDLDGSGGGAADLKEWITEGFDGIIWPYTWYPEQAGVATSIFASAVTLVGDEVLLPVFDKVCNGKPENIYPTPSDEFYRYGQCTWNLATPVADDLTKEGTQTNFHVVAFSQFHITCVQTGKNKVYPEDGLELSGKGCPGHDKAVEVGSLDPHDKTIEGYFVEDTFIYGYGSDVGDWKNIGTFTVKLVR
jgi:hypothetical protein